MKIYERIIIWVILTLSILSFAVVLNINSHVKDYKTQEEMLAEPVDTLNIME